MSKWTSVLGTYSIGDTTSTITYASPSNFAYGCTSNKFSWASDPGPPAGQKNVHTFEIDKIFLYLLYLQYVKRIVPEVRKGGFRCW